METNKTTAAGVSLSSQPAHPIETDYLTLGSTPPSEDCAQVGASDYYEQTRKEIKAWRGQLERHFAPLPNGVAFVKKSFSHDFGSYHELVVLYDTNNQEACEFAYRVEGELPEFWDEQAKRELV